MQDLTMRCHIPWCETHSHNPSRTHINHRADVGTIDAGGSPVRVGLLYSEPAANVPEVGPAVTVHWDEAPAGEGEQGPAIVGLDVRPEDARALARLLAAAADRLDNGAAR